MLAQFKLLILGRLFRIYLGLKAVRKLDKRRMPIGVVLLALLGQIIVAPQIQNELVGSYLSAEVDREGQILMDGSAPGMIRIVAVSTRGTDPVYRVSRVETALVARDPVGVGVRIRLDLSEFDRLGIGRIAPLGRVRVYDLAGEPVVERVKAQVSVLLELALRRGLHNYRLLSVERSRSEASERLALGYLKFKPAFGYVYYRLFHPVGEVYFYVFLVRFKYERIAALIP